VHGFSEDSHRRCMRLLMAVDWGGVPAHFVTLTYHREQPGGWEAWKRDLRTWRKRLERRWGDRLLALWWRLEFQRRGSPHFHLVVWWRGCPPNRKALQEWVSESWNAVAEPGDEAHLAAGTNVTRVRNTRGEPVARLIAYLAKYVGKLQPYRAVDRETGELLQTGRAWGYSGAVPFARIGTVELSGAEWEMFCSAINRAGEGTGSWYLGAISPEWSGFAIYGDGLLLVDKLLGDIPLLRWTQAGLAPAGP